MTDKEKFEDTMKLIRDTSLFLVDLTHRGETNKLNLYRIFLNEKIMEAVRLKKKINDELEG